MSSRDLRPLLLTAAAGVLVAFLHTVVGVGPDALVLVPPLLLLVPLLTGRYIGERQLLRLIARRRPARLVAPTTIGGPLRARRDTARELLLAALLGGRAPPRCGLVPA